MGNRLSGPFPMALTKITTLTNLSIEGNEFRGLIPPKIGHLTQMEKLIISTNEFTGPLPAALSLLTNLTDLRISGNNLSGRVPDFLGKLTKLEKLQIEGSLLEGPIPLCFAELTNLYDLRIRDLRGSESAFPDLSGTQSMKTLIFRNCSISGSIPSYIGDMENLKHLDLSFNKMTGEGTCFCSQVYELSPVFQHKDWIMEQWEKNFYIIAIARAANGSSLVVMSKEPTGICDGNSDIRWRCTGRVGSFLCGAQFLTLLFSLQMNSAHLCQAQLTQLGCPLADILGAILPCISDKEEKIRVGPRNLLLCFTVFRNGGPYLRGLTVTEVVKLMHQSCAKLFSIWDIQFLQLCWTCLCLNLTRLGARTKRSNMITLSNVA